MCYERCYRCGKGAGVHVSLLTEIQDSVQTQGNVHPSEIVDDINYDDNELSLGNSDLAIIVDDVWIEDKRWCTVRMAVINRGDENVAYVYNEPSTEMQDWSDWSAGDTEVYEVIGKEVTTIRYVRA